MFKMFYYDTANRKQGPIYSKEDAQQLINKGIIKPETLIENEKSQQTYAKNVTGWIFPQISNTGNTTNTGKIEMPPVFDPVPGRVQVEEMKPTLPV